MYVCSQFQFKIQSENSICQMPRYIMHENKAFLMQFSINFNTGCIQWMSLLWLQCHHSILISLWWIILYKEIQMWLFIKFLLHLSLLDSTCCGMCYEVWHVSWVYHLTVKLTSVSKIWISYCSMVTHRIMQIASHFLNNRRVCAIYHWVLEVSQKKRIKPSKVLGYSRHRRWTYVELDFGLYWSVCTTVLHKSPT